MAKKNWESMAEADALSAIGVSRHRGRGWKIFSGLLVVATATFVVGYFVPLYRAHELLQREYRTASSDAATFRKQLTDTVATLNQSTEENSKLQGELRARSKVAEDFTARVERIERSIQNPLKKFQGKGKMLLERQKDKLRITLAAPALLAQTGGNLTEYGKKAVCAIGAPLKVVDVSIVVRGLGVAPTDKDSDAWQLASVRAANTAQLLSKTCGLESSHIEVRVSASPDAADGSAVALELSPRS